MSQKFSLETKYDLLQPSNRFICTEHIVSLNMKGWKILWTFFCNHLLGKVRKLVLAHLSMSITKNFVLQDLLKYSKIGHLYVLSKRAPIFWPDELPEYILVYLTSG